MRFVDRVGQAAATGATKRAELRGVISTKPGLNRYLRVTPGGLLRVDQKAVAAEAKLDGKLLAACGSDDGAGESGRLRETGTDGRGRGC